MDNLKRDFLHNSGILDNLVEQKIILEDTIRNEDLVRQINSFKYKIWKDFEPSHNPLVDDGRNLEFEESQDFEDNYGYVPFEKNEDYYEDNFSPSVLKVDEKEEGRIEESPQSTHLIREKIKPKYAARKF